MTLMKCPFCGADAKLEEKGQPFKFDIKQWQSENYVAHVTCSESYTCAMKVGLGITQEEATKRAIELWHTRYTPKEDIFIRLDDLPEYKNMFEMLADYCKKFNLYDDENPDFAVSGIYEKDGNFFLKFEEADKERDFANWNNK